MGICLAATSLSDRNIRALLAEPPLVWRVLAPEQDAYYLEAIGRARRPGWLARLLGDKRPWPPEVPDLTFEPGERQELDMDKAWDGVNFCLKKLLREASCPNFFEDGTPIGDVDVGYGPAACFDSETTARIARACGEISRDRFLSAYAPAEMGDVYPSGLWQRNDEDTAYLVDNFLELQAFLRQAAQHQMGVLVYYT